MENKTEEFPKKYNSMPLVIIIVIIAVAVIYFWRQDIEYKKCYQSAPKNTDGSVIYDNPYRAISSERCKVILNR